MTSGQRKDGKGRKLNDIKVENEYYIVKYANCAEEYGLEDVELSFELTFERINRLGGTIKRGIITYGYLPLMLTVNCPAKSENISCKTCKNNSKMTDRKGEKFPLKCDGICTEVLNCVPLYIPQNEFSTLSTSFYSLRLTVENYVESNKNMRIILIRHHKTGISTKSVENSVETVENFQKTPL